jgi:beta propeller repeat protein
MPVKQKYPAVLYGMLLLCPACFAAAPSAIGGWAPGKSIPVCTAPGNQHSPAISASNNGLLVVWQDSRPDGKNPDTKYPWSIYGRYLEQGKEFSVHVPPDANAMNPNVDGNNVAWVHNRGWSALVMTTLEDGQPGEVKQLGSAGSKPAIDGNLVVWASAKNRWEAGEGHISWITDIRVFELDGPGLSFDVTNSARQPEFSPAVSGSTIVWQEACAGRSGWSSMFLRYRNIDRDAGGRRLTGIRDQKSENPAIDDSFVVWQDDRNGNWDIYGFDLESGEEREICKGPGDQTNPALHGSTVVWQDNRSGNWDIYGYSITAGETVPVFIGAGNQTGPDICGDVVVWSDERDGDKNIYMNRGKSGTDDDK